MKMLCKLVSLSFVLSCVVDAREFLSADGKSTLDAEFIRFDIGNNKVTLQTSDGRRIVTTSDKFSEKDQKFFKESQKALDLKDSITVATKEKSGGRDSQLRGQFKYLHKSSAFEFTVSNSAESNFAGLEMRYWVVVERENPKGPGVETLTGKSKIESLKGSGEVVLKGPELKLTTGCISACKKGCPKIKAHAAKVGRDRVIGYKVEVVDSSGTVLFTETSSLRTESILKKDSEKS